MAQQFTELQCMFGMCAASHEGCVYREGETETARYHRVKRLLDVAWHRARQGEINNILAEPIVAEGTGDARQIVEMIGHRAHQEIDQWGCYRDEDGNMYLEGKVGGSPHRSGVIFSPLDFSDVHAGELVNTKTGFYLLISENVNGSA